MNTRTNLLARLAAAGVAVACLLFFALRHREAPSSREGPTLEQFDPEHPCGVVAVTMATEVLGRRIESGRAKQAIPVDALGRTSMAEIIDGLGALGFQAVGVKLDMQSLRRLEGLPVILFVDRSHFLVALPVGDGSVVVMDPPHPVRVETSASLSSRWTGEAILLHHSPDQLRKAIRSLGIAESEAFPKL